MKILVKNVEKRTAKNGNNYWVVTSAEGDKYTTFDKAIGENIKEGKEYNISVKTEKGFNTISTINLGIISMPEAKPEPKQTKQETKDYWAKRNKEIRRLSILKAATNLAIGRKKYSVEEVFKIANEMENWVLA